MSSRDEEYVARLESMIAGLQREAAESQRELEESQEQRAQAARDGSMGRDWRDVQRRIDAGQTTVADVFSGQDDSAAAQRLVELSRENIARMADTLSPELQEELYTAEAEYSQLGRGGVVLRVVEDDGTRPA